ncbi:MAG: thioredoxin family protein [Pseudomonadota bacterium]
MAHTARFYHAGCPICVSAEQQLLDLIDPAVAVEVVHLGSDPGRLQEARDAGVRSVPALVTNGHALHINYGASLDAVEQGG